MKTENGKVDGDLRITEDFALNGVVTGSVAIAGGATLELRGMVAATVLLEPGSHVELRGKVNGDVINNGGRLRVFGYVGGSLIGASGTTLVHPKAVVAGRTEGSVDVLAD